MWIYQDRQASSNSPNRSHSLVRAQVTADHTPSQQQHPNLSLPRTSEVRGNRSAMKQEDKYVCMYTCVGARTHMCMLVLASFHPSCGAVWIVPPPRLGTMGQRVKCARCWHQRGICPWFPNCFSLCFSSMLRDRGEHCSGIESGGMSPPGEPREWKVKVEFFYFIPCRCGESGKRMGGGMESPSWTNNCSSPGWLIPPKTKNNASLICKTQLSNYCMSLAPREFAVCL